MMNSHKFNAPTSGSDLTWNDRLLVGHATIDETHREFVEIATALKIAGEESIPECLAQIESHVLSHFESELSLMEKSNFPATDCHVDEHNKVVDAVQKVRHLHTLGQVNTNDVRRLAQALIDWFPGHLFYMDSALSTWLSKKEHCGSPLIFHRTSPKLAEQKDA